MKILIQGGRVIDPASNLDEKSDVALANGVVSAIKNIATDFVPDQVIDATGCIVMPGLVDLCVRLREPGHAHEGMLASELALLPFSSHHECPSFRHRSGSSRPSASP